MGIAKLAVMLVLPAPSRQTLATTKGCRVTSPTEKTVPTLTPTRPSSVSISSRFSTPGMVREPGGPTTVVLIDRGSILVFEYTKLAGGSTKEFPIVKLYPTMLITLFPLAFVDPWAASDGSDALRS